MDLKEQLIERAHKMVPNAKQEESHVMSAVELHKGGHHSSLIIGEEKLVKNEIVDDDTNKVTERSSASMTVVNPAGKTMNQKSESNVPFTCDQLLDTKTQIVGLSLPECRIEESKKEESASMVTDEVINRGSALGRNSNLMRAEISEGIDLFNHSQSIMKS